MVKSTVEISQNFVAFSEYMNFSYLVIESKRSEMSIVLFFVGIFSKEGLSLVEIAVAIGVSTTVISLQNVTIRPATCRNMSEPLINCVIKI